jgi:dTDP-4-dehydrorhamnose 3,5-epimerase
VNPRSGSGAAAGRGSSADDTAKAALRGSDAMQYEPLDIPACYRIRSKAFSDNRGGFQKVLQRSWFGGVEEVSEFAEFYFSTSKRGVIRGMHFQAPPHDHQKLVACVKGRTCHSILDLRRSSPTYGRFTSVSLGDDNVGILIAKGCAHGFQALSEEAALFYCVSTEYAPSHDKGILWNSFGFEWPLKDPVLSDRDRSFIPFSEFHSPFL